MDKPDYMNSLYGVAKELGEDADLTLLGERIKTAWLEFEQCAQYFGYDLFCEELPMASQLRIITKRLFQVPGADWQGDVKQIEEKDKEYGGSWCKRGGTNAFYMLVRKWDRIEKAMEANGTLARAIQNDSRDEGILDDFGDLRRYLLLVQAWRHARLNPVPDSEEVSGHGFTPPGFLPCTRHSGHFGPCAHPPALEVPVTINVYEVPTEPACTCHIDPVCCDQHRPF